MRPPQIVVLQPERHVRFLDLVRPSQHLGADPFVGAGQPVVAADQVLDGLRHPYYAAFGNHDVEGEHSNTRKAYIMAELGDHGLSRGEPWYTFSPIKGTSFVPERTRHVDVAADRFAEHGLEAGFMQADIAQLPLPEASVDLFALRVRAIAPDFAKTPDLEPIIEDICRQLDGLPLAIELDHTSHSIFIYHARSARIRWTSKS